MICNAMILVVGITLLCKTKIFGDCYSFPKLLICGAMQLVNINLKDCKIEQFCVSSVGKTLNTKSALTKRTILNINFSAVVT